MQPSNSVSEIWESMRTSEDDSVEQVKNIKYWSALPPFSQTSSIVGSIDSIKLKTDQRVLLRGWIFSLHSPVVKLELSLTEPSTDWDSVLTVNLSRNDVARVFPFAPQAAFCGFVLARPPANLSIGQDVVVHFRICLLNGEQRTGYFKSCPVSPAVST